MGSLERTILLVALLLISVPLLAQQRDGRTPARPQQPAQSTKFVDRIFYGGNLIFNFGSSTGYSEFNLGITPLIGFKIFPGFSMGPKGTIIYSNIRLDTGIPGEPDLKANEWTWAVGAFARYRIIPALFLHAEYELEEVPYYDFNLNVFRLRRDNFYVGGGFFSGGPVGVEVVALYNVINTSNDNFRRSPWVIRFGVVAGL